MNDGAQRRQLGALHGVLAFEIRAANGFVQRAFVETYAGAGYVPKQYSVTLLLAENEGIHLKQLAGLMGLDPSTLMPVLDRLEDEKIVKRVRSNQDRRVVTLHLTRKGRAEVAKAHQMLRAYDAILTSEFTAKERSAFFDALEKISRAAGRLLDAKAEPSRRVSASSQKRKRRGAS